MGRFLDGGLLANNPTLDAMSEIHQYNKALKAEVGYTQDDRPNLNPNPCFKPTSMLICVFRSLFFQIIFHFYLFKVLSFLLGP